MRGLIESRFGLTYVILVFGALLTVTAPCGAQLSPAQRDSVETQVQAALDSLTDAWRHWDVDGMMRFYLDSALVAANGRLSSQSEHRAASARRTGVHGQKLGVFRPIRFDVLSRDAVVVSWVNAFAAIDTGGRVRPTMIAATTDVWVRRGRAWRILVQHESTRIAPDSMTLSPSAAQSSHLENTAHTRR